MRRSALALVAAAGFGACISVRRPTVMQPAPEREWPDAIALAQQDAAQSQFASADSVLAAYATKYPGTQGALETGYWRALFLIDPTNPSWSVANSTALLDGYIADPRPRDHLADALVVRHLAAHLDELNKVAATALAKATGEANGAANAKAQAADAAHVAATKTADVDSSDAEIKRLKSELAQANAELARIRKRLATPPPGKPPLAP
jgi:hypothetical protein